MDVVENTKFEAELNHNPTGFNHLTNKENSIPSRRFSTMTTSNSNHFQTGVCISDLFFLPLHDYINLHYNLI